MKFFIADTHFGQMDAIRNHSRPFGSIEEHDESIIQNWNSVVGEDDDVYHLGDFAFNPFYRNNSREAEDTAIRDYIQILERLNGRIHWIYGNHDPYKKKRFMSELKPYLVWMGHYLEIVVRDDERPKGKQKVVLHHYPYAVWNHCERGSIHLHGHTHGTLEDNPKRLIMDVGVDCQNYTPVSYEDVKRRMREKMYVDPVFSSERLVNFA